MATTDQALMEIARPHFLAAMASFGVPGDDPFAVAGIIAAEAATAGFPPMEVCRLLDHLQAFLGEMLLSRLDPFLPGPRLVDVRKLFEPSALRGLFNPAQPVVEKQPELPFANKVEVQERRLLEQLIAATHLYDSAAAVTALMAFTIKLRAFAPFNAMILHIQKPGLTHAATASDWLQRFNRVPTRSARPLLVLRTMGPVDFVFDVLDTEGQPLPENAFTFPTLGKFSKDRLAWVVSSVTKAGIDILEIDRGDDHAGWICRLPPAKDPKAKLLYQLGFNRNHPPETRLVTIAHELAHLYLGHLGADKPRDIRARPDRSHAQREVEAEMTAYLVAKRNGLTPHSESYLDTYKGAFTDLDLYGVMKAANAVETIMGVSSAQLKAQAEGWAR